MKNTVFAHLGRYWQELYRACNCTEPHTRLEGSLTAAASAYPDRFCKVAVIAAREFPGGPGPWGRGYGAAGDGEAAARPRPRRKGSELFSVIISECLPWKPLVKHSYAKHGHINI